MGRHEFRRSARCLLPSPPWQTARPARALCAPVMSPRRLALTSGLGLILLFGAAFVAALFVAPPEVQWRLRVVQAKVRGNLGEIPLRNLIAWLAPGSPVYLEGVAENPNLHVSIRNGLTKPDDAAQGKVLYLRHCGQCHGEGGHGSSGPNLLSALVDKSDWSFFSTAKWGRQGTSMQAQPVGESQIWKIHAYLRNESLAALGQPSIGHGKAAARAVVEVERRRIVETDKTPGEWLTYAGNYAGHRHSLLRQLTKSNVGNLRLAWVAQLRQVDRELQVSPIVVEGVMFVSESREGVVALDAKTGEVIWTYRRPVPDAIGCCGAPNRGVAVLGHTVFVATSDSFLVALDANTGKQRWIVNVAVAGGEFGIRGFLAAFDTAEGRQLWKFHTVPGPGEAGHDTWTGNAWK